MRKLFIAHAEGDFAEAIIRQLNGAYEIELCSHGEVLLDRIDCFDPDILLVDLALCGAEALSVLHTLRNTGRSMQVVVITACNQSYVVNSLARLCVSSVFMKPCKPSAVVACIYEISTGAMENNAWFVESEIDLILLRLGFRMGPARYSCVYHSIFTRYQEPLGCITKHLYPEVAHICGGSVARVEKAVRDAIHEAWRHGDRRVWQMYFPPGKGCATDCPSNEEFISRVAAVLQHRARICAPGKLLDRIAK